MNATAQTYGSVLVGVDGSVNNASAVAWAAAEASSSHSPLVVVHATADEGGDSAGRALVDRARLLVSTRVDSSLGSESRVVHGHAADALRGTVQGDLLVVGRRGAGGCSRMQLGSTARNLVHEPGPAVVVVPTGWRDPEVTPDLSGAVVADLTAAADPQAVLALAVPRAARTGRPVLVVSTWAVPPSAVGEGRPIAEVWQTHQERASAALEDALAPWRSAYPEVVLQGRAGDRHGVAALLDLADSAALVVVARSDHAFSVVEYAECPVAVVPARS